MSSSTGLRRRLASLPTEAVESGRVAVLLVGLSLTVGLAYWVDLRVPNGPVLGVVVSPYTAGLAVPSALHARYRGFDLPLSLPRRDRLGPALAAVLAPTAAVFLVAGATDALFGVSLGTVLGHRFAPQTRFLPLLSFFLRPAAVVGVGFGVFLCGALVEPVRTRLTARPASVAVFAGVVGEYFRATLWSSARTLVTFHAGWRLALFGFLVAATVAAGVSLGLLARGVADWSLDPVARLRYAPVFAFGLLALAGFADVLRGVPGVLEHLLWMVAFGASAAGYDRTRSLWVPVVALSFFALSLRVVGYVEMVV